MDVSLAPCLARHGRLGARKRWELLQVVACLVPGAQSSPELRGFCPSFSYFLTWPDEFHSIASRLSFSPFQLFSFSLLQPRESVSSPRVEKSCFYRIVFFFFFGWTPGLWKIPGQALSRSYDLWHSCGSTGSLTTVPQWELPASSIFHALSLHACVEFPPLWSGVVLSLTWRNGTLAPGPVPRETLPFEVSSSNFSKSSSGP